MLLQDLRLAARLLLKDRWYTAVAVLALGLGIGVNNTIFTFVNAVLLRGLPYEDSHRIMYLGLTNPEAGRRNVPVSYPDYEEWRTGSRSFEDLAAVRTGTMNVSESSRPAERVFGAWVSANTFGLLGQQAASGRTFLPDEDQPGAEPVAIIGYGLWQTRYAGAPDILGRVIRINERPTRIVGVLPQGVRFPSTSDLWLPLVPDAEARRRTTQNLGVFGRLKPDVTRGQAQAEMATIARTLADQYPDSNRGLTAVVMPYNDRFNGGEIKLVFLALMGAVALVLLIACANVANLLLARSAARAREMAVRVSLGATRWRIVRQLLIESVLLGVVAGVFGLALSVVGVRLFDQAVRDVNKPFWIVFTMDGPVFAFLAAICLLTGVLFGLAPALQLSRASLTELVKDGGRGGLGVRSRRFSGAMVVTEVALTMVLLVGAGLMVRSYFNMQSLQLGFDTSRLIGAGMVLAEARYDEPDARVRLQEQLHARLAAVPGVRSVTVASGFPLFGGSGVRVEVAGQPVTDRNLAPQVASISAGEGYFETLGVTLRQGRAFHGGDGRPGAEVAIVNEQFASQFYNGEAIGQRFRVLDPERATPWLTIVGVSPNIRQDDPQDLEASPVIYVPFRQSPTRFLALLARAEADAASITQPIRQAAQEITPDQPLFSLRTFDELLAEQAWMWRIFGTLFAVFAVIALVLSAVGLYAITAYSVSQRTQEIGVRMALGAQPGEISWLVLRRGLAQLGVGMALGLVGAWGASGLIQNLLAQMSAHDAGTFIGVSALLSVVTVAACVLPSRRAMRVDPVIALRAG